MSEPRLVYIIEGRRYEAVGLDEITLWDQIDISRETGFTPERLELLLRDVVSAGDPGARFATADEVYTSPDHILATAVHQWMARRAAGEKSLTIREAAEVPLRDVTLTVEVSGPQDPTEAP